METTSSEILTVEQFAERLQVSRTTVFTWIKKGALQESVHYFRLGRVLRFCWREGIFFNSQQKPVSEDEGQETPPLPIRRELDFQRGAATVHNPPLTFGRGNAPAVNLDY